MNISYNWLKDYLQFELNPEQVSAALTSIGLETGSIEEVQSIKGGLEGLVVGHVLTCVNHPNSDHLHVTTVDLGNGEPVQIVCGAANVAAGQKVIVATVGTTLYDGDQSFQIKKSKIRGEESFGMICAEDEIGIGTSHEGIIELPLDAPVGMPAKEYYNIKSDYILEVDITPNRVDAASHFGVARDLAAYLKQHVGKADLVKPSVDAFSIDKKDGAATVCVENSEACPRYSGVTIQGVKINESPEWLKNKLESIGLRSINNVVDITNYILHETGHPLHAFDLGKIHSKKVIVKTVEPGTKFTTLDGVEHTLNERDLMICNENEPMCLAGVFGGLDSGVTDSTKDVFLESAYFNPTWIRKAARRHGLNTDSSFRFERGADPNNTMYVLKRAALLIKEIAGGEIVGEPVDIYPTPIEKAEVSLTYNKINTLVGNDIAVEDVKNILSSLEMEIVSENAEGLVIKIPTYRVDVYRDVDVIEDILRIYGYNNIDFSENVKSNLSYKTATDESNQLQNLISEQLVGAGFNEILNNSLTAEAFYSDLTTYPAANCVRLINPLSNDLNVMRQTLLFGGLQSVARNVNHRAADLRFFEFGNCQYFNAEKHNGEKVLSGYSEEAKLALWLTGNKVSGSWAHQDEKSSVFVLKAAVENIFTRLGIDLKKLKQTQFNSDIYAVGLDIALQNGKSIATLGILSHKILAKFDIEQDVFFAEINWNIAVKEAQKSTITYSEISKFPPVKRDLALLLDQNILFSDIEKVAFDTDRKLLKEVYLFDVYEGKNLPAGKKSYAASFILQDETKTLNDKQIDNFMSRLIKNLETKLGATLR
ncbi:MAG: phenylalanine--tRNA ligase subunit beta [Bacteroidales bacterium]|nr:phenylalanine--tRNA ligase subunit beta [Bacteroidales bacterium]